MLITKSIYLSPNDPPANIKDRIAFHASEAQTLEQLLVMGYAASNHVNLTDRLNELNREISRLEEELKHQFRPAHTKARGY